MAENNYLAEIASMQRLIIERLDEPRRAQIAVDKADRPANIIRLNINLNEDYTEISPRKIGYAFRSIYVEHCDNPSAKIKVKPITNEAHQSYFSMGYKDSWSVDRAIPDAFLFWEQQVGWITLILFIDSEFNSGSQVSLTAGGLSISEGATAAHSNLNMSPNVATEILPQNLFRKTATIVNDTGNDIFLGSDLTVNASSNKGIPVANGDSVKWRNTAQLFGFSTGGGKIIILEET